MKNIIFYFRSGILVIVLLSAVFFKATAQSSPVQADKFKTAERIINLDGGNIRLNHGTATVQFSPEIARRLARGNGAYFVSLTPVGDCGALKVLKKSDSGFTVQEISEQNSNASFDYLVFVKRTVNTGLVDANAVK